MSISIRSALHPDLDLLAYRVEGRDVHPVTITPGTPLDGAKPFGLLQEVGGTVGIPGLGEVAIDAPGLYRIQSYAHKTSLQWVVYDADVFTLAASVSSIFYHLANEPKLQGGDPEGLRQQHLQYALDNAVRGKVAGVCLTAANFFALVCNWLKLKAVVWELENISTDLKPFNTHAMAEVYLDSLDQPVLFDIDRGRCFKNAAGEPLSLQGFMEHSRAGAPLTIQVLTNKPYGGYGPGSRIPTAMDVTVDLYQLGGEAVDQDFYHALGTAEIVLGRKAYGDTGQVTTPLARERAKATLDADDGSIPDARRVMLKQVLGMASSDF